MIATRTKLHSAKENEKSSQNPQSRLCESISRLGRVICMSMSPYFLDAMFTMFTMFTQFMFTMFTFVHVHVFN